MISKSAPSPQIAVTQGDSHSHQVNQRQRLLPRGKFLTHPQAKEMRPKSTDEPLFDMVVPVMDISLAVHVSALLLFADARPMAARTRSLENMLGDCFGASQAGRLYMDHRF